MRISGNEFAYSPTLSILNRAFSDTIAVGRDPLLSQVNETPSYRLDISQAAWDKQSAEACADKLTPSVTEVEADTVDTLNARSADNALENDNFRAAGTAKTSSGQKASLDEMQQQQEVRQLEITEQKVRSHEMAHKAAGGRYAGSISYAYTTGPDGKKYISGGQVPIDLSEEKTPEATIQKMSQVKRAALAPADPSASDRTVAAKAAMTAMKVRSEIRTEVELYARSQSMADNPQKQTATLSVYA